MAGWKVTWLILESSFDIVTSVKLGASSRKKGKSNGKVRRISSNKMDLQAHIYAELIIVHKRLTGSFNASILHVPLHVIEQDAGVHTICSKRWQFQLMGKYLFISEKDLRHAKTPLSVTGARYNSNGSS